MNKKEWTKTLRKIQIFIDKKKEATIRIRDFKMLRRACFKRLRKDGSIEISSNVWWTYNHNYNDKTYNQVVGYFILNGYKYEKHFYNYSYKYTIII